MINILYFLYFFGAFILSILILPAPYDNGFGIVICLSIFIVIPILYRLSKYLILMLKTKHLLKKKGFKTTKFCYFPFPSRFRGRYNMSFENDNKVINVVFLSKKLKYKNYHFESENLVKFSSYARVMLYHGNRSGMHGSRVSRTNVIHKNNFGEQKILWPENNIQKDNYNIILFDKWPDYVTDFTNHNDKSIGQGDFICKSNIQAFDTKAFAKFIETI